MPKQSKVVEAVGKTSGSYSSKDIESIMNAAADQAAADGITDPNEIRELKLAARQEFKDERRAQAAAQAHAEAHGITDEKELRKFEDETRARFEKQRRDLVRPKGQK